jgi:hypothetical protein
MARGQCRRPIAAGFLVFPVLLALGFGCRQSQLTTTAAFAAATDAQAPTVNIERIDIVEYGIYTADEQSCTRNAQGILSCARVDIHHSVTTLTVPAQHGVHFGFRYKIVGTPEGATVRVTGITNFPPAGLNKPGTSEPLRSYRYSDNEKVGQIGYTDYAFDDPWELVAGPWSVEIWIDNRLMASRTFNVVPSP